MFHPQSDHKWKNCFIILVYTRRKHEWCGDNRVPSQLPEFLLSNHSIATIKVHPAFISKFPRIINVSDENILVQDIFSNLATITVYIFRIHLVASSALATSREQQCDHESSEAHGECIGCLFRFIRWMIISIPRMFFYTIRTLRCFNDWKNCGFH